MKPSVAILCALICFSTYAIAKGRGKKDCNAPMTAKFIECDNNNTTIYAYNITSKACVPCCGCFGHNSFEGKDRCENKCKRTKKGKFN